jgi:hypothetical protein
MRLKWVKEILLLAAVALVLSLPILVRGPMPSAHDTAEHMDFGKHFAEQFWQGDLYPRWLLNMHHGLGSPTFFIFPPFPSYVYALLLPVAKIIRVDALSLDEYLCLLTSGLCAWRWMTTIASTRVSLIAAVIYMLLPYHLTIDFYRRNALPECWALAWMPLVLYFTTQAVRKKRYAIPGLALAYALLIASHPISVLILSALPPLLALTIAERGRKARALATVIGSLAIGAAVSAAYLLPALANAKYFPASKLDLPVPREDLLVFGWGLLTGHTWKSQFVQAVSLATADTIFFILLCGFMALKNGPRSRRGQTILWLAVCPIPLFLMSSPSLGLWDALPALRNAVQFPWRFDVILCIAALPLAAFFLTDVLGGSVRARAGFLVIILFFTASWIGGCIYAVRCLALNHFDNPVGTSVIEADGWFDAWAPSGISPDTAFQVALGPPARFRTGQCTADVLLWKPRRIEVQTNCTAGGPLVVNQFYYPKWEAQLFPGGARLHVEPALPQGLLEVQVPPGCQHVLLEIPRGLDEQVGNWLSVLGILICAVLAASAFARNRTDSGLESGN